MDEKSESVEMESIRLSRANAKCMAETALRDGMDTAYVKLRQKAKMLERLVILSNDDAMRDRFRQSMANSQCSRCMMSANNRPLDYV